MAPLTSDSNHRELNSPPTSIIQFEDPQLPTQALVESAKVDLSNGLSSSGENLRSVDNPVGWSEESETLTEFQLFPKLHLELKLMIISHLLISDEPIINPWLYRTSVEHLWAWGSGEDKNNEWGMRKDEDCHKRRWQGFDSAVLFTCKWIHAEGIRILFMQNTFRFARLATGYYGHIDDHIESFLTAKIHRYLSDGTTVTTHVSELIRSVQVQEWECDKAAEKDRRRPISITYLERGEITFPLRIVNILAKASCSLRSLRVVVPPDMPQALSELIAAKKDQLVRYR